MNFETTITDTLVIGQPEDKDYESSNITVKWGIEFETRTEGLKGIYISIESISGELEDEDDSEDLIDISKYTIINSLSVEDGQCFPNQVWVDMEKKTVEVS